MYTYYNIRQPESAYALVRKMERDDMITSLIGQIRLGMTLRIYPLQPPFHEQPLRFVRTLHILSRDECLFHFVMKINAMDIFCYKATLIFL